MKAIFTILLLLLYAGHVIGQSTITGRVVDEKGVGLPGVNVFLVDTYDGTSTDLEGHFSFKTSEEGNYQLKATFVGYEAMSQEITLPGDNEISVLLKEVINRLDAVVISAGSFSAGEESSREVLKPLDIVTTAGATADIAGALNTLPGTQTVGETGRLFVRGGDGYETRTYIDGMEVLESYSPSAPNTPSRGRFSPFMFKGTSFSTGGYSAEYGQALSSALILNTKDMAAQNRTDLSLMSVGADVSHSQVFGKSSISGKIQYTNLEPYFALISQRINYDKAPEAWDGNMAYRHQIGESGMLKTYANWSSSQLAVYQPQSFTNLEDRLEIDNNYHYLNVSYRDVINTKWSFNTGAAYTSSKEDIQFNDVDIEDQLSGAHVKGVVNFDPDASLSIRSGLEHYYRQHNYNLSEENEFKENYNQHISTGFIEADYYLSNDLVIRSGVRTETNNLNRQTNVYPRLSVAQQLGEHGQVSLGYGKFSQQAQREYLRVNTNLDEEKATHYIANYQYMTGKRTFRVEGYYKSYNDLVKDGTQGPNNEGQGYATGFDIFWRDNQSVSGLDYWVSYSYIDSERDYRDYPQQATPAFSSTHNLSIVGKYFVQDIKTQIGATYSFASARPYNNLNEEAFNAGRTPAYHDLSVNFSYLYRSNVIIHASVTNVLGVDNIFGYEYASEPNEEGIYQSQPIKQMAPRFIFLGVFITLAKNKAVNQMPNL